MLSRYRRHHCRQRREVTWQRDLTRDYERRGRHRAADRRPDVEASDRPATPLTRLLLEFEAVPKSQPGIAADDVEREKRIRRLARLRKKRQQTEALRDSATTADKVGTETTR